ncbi:MAG: SGNH/GDSL hydrolase family protein, partial [Candidatus Bathyarchaeia archaeon]
DYVVVWGGINDLFMLWVPESVYGDLRRIYDRALEGDIGPIACTVTPVLGYDGLMPRIVELNNLIRGHCRERVIPYADLFTAVSDESGRLRETFSSDGVHLSYAGYHRVAYAIYHQVIEPILDGWKR